MVTTLGRGSMDTTTLIWMGAGAFLVLLVGALHNNLVRRRNAVEEAFGGMDAQLKQRWDLIPNLISVVKGSMEHEAALVKSVTGMRTEALSGDLDTNEKVVLDNRITEAMGGIMVASEAYPDLKASENFALLQRSMNEVEAQISASRRAYNAAVRSYNDSVGTFPGSIVAALMGFKRKTGSDIPESQRESP